MAFIGFVKKLSTELAKQLRFVDEKILLKNEEIFYFELCGIVLAHSILELEICDFYGTITIKKNANLQIERTGSFLFKIKPYIYKGRVELLCKDFKKVSIYEEMAFNLELKALEEINSS